MHEYHIVDALVKQVVAKAAEHKASSVAVVHLAMAHDSGLDSGSIRLYFSQIAAGTSCADAALVFEAFKRVSADTPALYIKDIEVE